VRGRKQGKCLQRDRMSEGWKMHVWQTVSRGSPERLLEERDVAVVAEFMRGRRNGEVTVSGPSTFS